MTGKVSDKLSGLNVIPFYKQRPAMPQNETVGDTIETARIINKVESQSLEKVHYALSTEDVEAVYPELVYEKENGNKGINYMEMIPLLVQSVNELKAEVATLRKENSLLKDAMNGSKTDNRALYIDMGGKQIRKSSYNK